ncbi:related to NAD dependent epimerase/dehydratase family protein [Phialocephala subalpina]|uniref:Related to NAD dependent epimerase/dehydratase family protein n=1 Tax=Phialocephala subalpina TaxID=576137 RepID=A0A1L7XVY0_9HELO|nr:related to NAD dependent epimerase/dehydratase family protein [Phialocephala subalpina]
MASSKILLTGATGYIGGAVLAQILESIPDVLAQHSISVLIRGQEKIAVYEKMGVKPILFKSLDETDFLQKLASGYDIIIHTASGFHTASAKALVTGLGDRKKQTGKEVHYIHTTGTSNLGDQPISGKYHEDRIFSDKEDIFAYEKMRESKQIYAQRTTDIAAVETGLANGVQTHLIMSPTIYGVGSGKFNKLSIQVPKLIRASLKAGHALVIGDGKGVWNYVHINDLADLYVILLQKILNGEKVPVGEQIMFSETGTFAWIDLSQHIADALHELGAVETNVVGRVELQDAADLLANGNLLGTELGFTSTSITKSELARELGWKPVKTEKDFKSHFLEEAKLILAETN